MKKLLVFLAGVLVCMNVCAQEERYLTSFFSTAEWSSKDKSYIWSDWVESDEIPVTIDISNRKIAIYSDQFQEYTILKQKDEGNDGLGYFKDYSATDQDGKSCIVKLRVQKEGSIRQICIYQKEEAWAYCFKSRTTN